MSELMLNSELNWVVNSLSYKMSINQPFPGVFIWGICQKGSRGLGDHWEIMNLTLKTTSICLSSMCLPCHAFSFPFAAICHLMCSSFNNILLLPLGGRLVQYSRVMFNPKRNSIRFIKLHACRCSVFRDFESWPSTESW